MECATVITLQYERSARALYRELRDAAEAAGWSVRRRHDPEYEYWFDARRGRQEPQLPRGKIEPHGHPLLALVGAGRGVFAHRLSAGRWHVAE